MEKGHQYLRILGVSISATEKDIKNAYRKKARDLHPDKNPSPEGKDSNFDTKVLVHAGPGVAFLNSECDTAELFIRVKEAYDYLVDNHKRRELKEDTEQAAKAKQAYQNRAKATKGNNRWGDPVPKKSRFQSEPTNNHKPTSTTGSNTGSSLAGKKRDTSHCANPHKIRFKWDKDKFKYDKKFFERLFPNYYDIKEEELYEFRDGYCFVLFRDDLDALDAHQIALELRPKPLKVKWITPMPDIAKQTLDSEEECYVVEKKKKKKDKSKYDRGYYKEMYDREKVEEKIERQWSSRAKKKVEYHDGIL